MKRILTLLCLALLSGRSSFTRESADRQFLALAYANDLGKVGPETKADYVMLAYDDICSIQFFGTNLRPYWNRTGGKTICGQMSLAAAEYEVLTAACVGFDARLMADATRSGGREYAELCALAYRQAIAAHDVGTYPLANGQTYPGDMPVEESGNMLILTAAIAQLEGIASYARLAGMLGRQDVAARYMAEARKMATEWKEMAFDGDAERFTGGFRAFHHPCLEVYG